MAVRDNIVLLIFSFSLMKNEPITAQLTCALASGSIAEYEADDIILSDVVYCSYAHRSKSLIVIRSFNTTYINCDYPAHQGVRIQPSLLIISPTVVVDGVRKMYLQGSSEDFIPVPGKPIGRGSTKGIPGRAGGTAGSILLAYRDKRLENGGSLLVDINGGAGGNGQAGQDGIDGSQGSRRGVSEKNDNDCSAWSGGWTKVWLTPNRCLDSYGSDGRCKTHDYARWEVYGYSGTAGSRGNDGGLGGRAGNGGLYLQVDIATGRNTTTNGNSGRTGANGLGGSGGNGGRKGDTNYLHIDDASSARGKWCKIKYQDWRPVNEWASNGASGTSGGNSNGAAAPPYRLEAKGYTSHIRSYVSKCDTRANYLNDNALRSFCTSVQNHFHL